MSEDNENKADGTIKRCLKQLCRLLCKPSAKYSLGALLAVGFVSGVIFWGGFNTAMEVTNTEQFCIGCHEMGDNVYPEYQQTVHYTNHSGVRATCPDCHVPKPWIHKMIRKIQASSELWHKAMGTIDTREKFEAKRLELARNVWRTMEDTDSRECRNCHNFEFMDFTMQENRAAKNHQRAVDTNMTCIDCHKGIAHELPKGAIEGQELSSN